MCAENGVEVLKEMFTSCVGLNFARVVGLFGFICKVIYFWVTPVCDHWVRDVCL